MPIRILRGNRQPEKVIQPLAQNSKGINLTWKRWGVGLANACLSGFAGGGMAQFVGVGWKQSLMITGASFFVSFCKWMAQHPLPGAE